jgi:hypothetical protein
MVIHREKIRKILEENEMLRAYVNTLTKSVDQCSNDVPSEMRLAKGHLDFIHYSAKILDTNEYNDVNDLLFELGTMFKKCKCE